MTSLPLSAEQLVFLEHHKVPLSKVFDATGLRRSCWQDEMDWLDAWVACGVTPCKREGHTLRTRNGDCVQCRPGNLAFLKRLSQPAFVYITYSKTAKLSKIGSSTDPDKRINLLNMERYGGVGDWKIYCCQDSQYSGRVELSLHKHFLLDKVDGTSYIKQGVLTESKELFTTQPETIAYWLKTYLAIEEGISPSENAPHKGIDDLYAEINNGGITLDPTASWTEKQRVIEAALDFIPDECGPVLRRIYGIGCERIRSAKALGTEMGISTRTVNELCKRGVGRLRLHLLISQGR